jgi:hypothetical protein
MGSDESRLFCAASSHSIEAIIGVALPGAYSTIDLSRINRTPYTATPMLCPTTAAFRHRSIGRGHDSHKVGGRENQTRRGWEPNADAQRGPCTSSTDFKAPEGKRSRPACSCPDAGPYDARRFPRTRRQCGLCIARDWAESRADGPGFPGGPCFRSGCGYLASVLLASS